MSEADTCRRYIVPKLHAAGWQDDQIREQVYITDGRITPMGRSKHTRGERLKPDYILDLRPFYPIAVVEAKADYKQPGDGLQQAMEYALRLDVKFAYASNGHGIVEHDFLTGVESDLETFPTQDELWARLRGTLRLQDDKDAADALTDYYERVGGKTPRYYQQVAINRAVEAVISGRKRILITMATGTGKTFVAFQIIWRLWQAKRRKRILYLADRNFLIDQAKDQTFSPMGDAVTKLKGRVIKSREMYFALYQALYNPGGGSLYEKYPRDFFDLIIVDECHRGSARDDSSWREILTYFNGATQIGMTATPRRVDNADTYAYFGDPIYTYSLAQGIEDGFLAPYRVQRIVTSSDALGVVIEEGERDRFGRDIPPGLYGTADFERVLSVLNRTKAVAHHLTEYLKRSGRMDKTIVFCVDQEHALQMRSELARLNADLMRVYPDYVARVVSDEGQYGRNHLDHFQDPERESPVILTSSQMLTTGVDAPTVRNVVLFRPIGSIVDFKQIIGRGTRLSPENDKFFFTILDYTGATQLFFDPDFDGFPETTHVATMDGAGNEVSNDPVDDPTQQGEPFPGDGAGPGANGDGDGGGVAEPRKYYIEGGPVYILGEQVFELDAEGNTLRTVSFTDYAGEQVRRLAPSADHLRLVWSQAEQRAEIVAELAKRGITFEALAEQAGRADADPVDLLLHVAYNAPLLTRRERAEKLRQTRPNFFNTYEPAARLILDGLLDKYADYGAGQFDNLADVLRVPPFSGYGNALEIARLFGGPEQMTAAVRRMQQLLYQE